MTGSLRSAGLAAAIIATVAVAACNTNREPSTPEAKRARGDELLKKMSAQLAGATSVSFTALQTREVVEGDKRTPRSRTVRYAVRRPDKAHLTFLPEAGGSTDVWYDGVAGKITLAHHQEKMWARGPMPKTLDEALDAAAYEYDIPTPVADFLYSSPYAAFEQTGSTGGWVGSEVINGQACEKLSFQSALLDWDLWISAGDRALPCQLKITYKQDDGKPTMTAVMKDWNLAAAHGEDEFTPKVDEKAYTRIALARAATADPEPEPTDAAGSTPSPAPVSDKK